MKFLGFIVAPIVVIWAIVFYTSFMDEKPREVFDIVETEQALFEVDYQSQISHGARIMPIIVTDTENGCQYISMVGAGITPRLNRAGDQVCVR